MSIRSLSAVSDLTDEIQNLLDEALGAGLEIDRIEEIAKEAIADWSKEATAAIAARSN